MHIIILYYAKIERTDTYYGIISSSPITEFLLMQTTQKTYSIKVSAKYAYDKVHIMV